MKPNERRNRIYLINSKTVEVLDATLSGVLNHDGCIEWYINIDCDSVEIDGMNTSPRIYLERFEWGINCMEEIINKEINIEAKNSISSKRFEVDITTKIDFLGINLGEAKDIEIVKKLIKFDASGLNYYQEDGTLYLIPEEK